MLLRLGRFALVLCLSACLASHARADEDRLTWGTAAGDMFSYELVEDDPPQGPPVVKGRWYDCSADTGWVVIVAEMEKGKHPSREVATISQLLWTLALDLPESAKEGSSAVQKALKYRSYPSLTSNLDVTIDVSGKEDVKRSGGTTRLTSTLTLDQKQVLRFNWLTQGSTLVLDRTFDESAHALATVKFDLTLALANGKGPVTTERHTGKLAFKGRLAAGSKELLESVDAAVKRGVKALGELLKTEIAYGIRERKDVAKVPGAPRDGEFGAVALATFALLRSGVPPEDLKDAFDFMAKCELRSVYAVSLYVMCLEARSVKRASVAPEAGGHTVSRYTRDPLPEGDKKEMNRALAWLLSVRSHGCWSYGVMPRAAAEAGGGDRSNTQFATLALHCAVQCKCTVDAAVFREIADELAQSQETEGPAQSTKLIVWTPSSPLAQAPQAGDGKTKTKAPEASAPARGWGYAMRRPCAPGTAYGSMTGGGVSSAAIAREALRIAGKLDGKLEAATRREIEDGVAWFLQSWSPSRDARQPTSHYGLYYLYSVEKAMELAGVETLGGRDWWSEGCAHLLASECKAAPGTWENAAFGQATANETAFALLFLNRATLPGKD